MGRYERGHEERGKKKVRGGEEWGEEGKGRVRSGGK